MRRRHPVKSGADVIAITFLLLGTASLAAAAEDALAKTQNAKAQSPAPEETGADPASVPLEPLQQESMNQETLEQEPGHWEDLESSPLVDPGRREALIEAHRPEPVTISIQSLLPPALTVVLEPLRARLLELAADHERARRSYERAIGFGSQGVALWRGLGRMRLRCGDLEGAESALLAAYELGITRAAADEETRAALLRELGEIYLLGRRPAEATIALERASDIAPGSGRLSALLERARLEREGRPSTELSADTPLWPPTAATRWRDRTEGALSYGYRLLPSTMKRPVGRLAEGVRTAKGRRLGAAAVGCALLLLAALRIVRGRGDLVVSIAFPNELVGTFSVRLASKPGRHARGGRESKLVGLQRRGLSTRRAHHMVSRETLYRKLVPRIHYVVIEGVLQDPDGKEILLRPYDEQAVEVRGRDTARVEFDFHPKEYPVDVNVFWDKQPTDDAAVAALGLPESLRFTRAGTTRLRVPRGSHTIMVGSGDRVAEHQVEVQSFHATVVEFDLAGSQGVIFKGCPPAVEPYLHGDLSAASRALERDGHTRLANLLLARLHRDQGHPDRAAQYFESAGCPLEAAEIHASLTDFGRAAELYLEAGDALRAAEMFRSAGDWVQAGSTYESAGDFEAAVECYREVRNFPRWLDALEKKGSFLEAAELALQQSDRARAIRLLQQVNSSDPRYGDACERLADAFEHEGHADLAAQKIEQCVEAGAGSADLQFRLGDLLEHAGEVERSLEAFEKLRDDSPTYPGVASRIENLRKKRSAQRLADSKPSGSISNTPTAFLSEQRYEILDELGRGGMGVVYRARDIRLDREVALKRLPDSLRDHPKAIQLFLREAQACARLNHRNIVTIYDTDQEDGNFFITMELLRGYPMNAIRRKKGRLAPRDVAHLGIQVAEGLEYAHSRQIVHRDIKTANLFFTTERVVKIMDFGLAKMMEEVRRGTTVMGGTPFYMAPEQALGTAIDHRADLYALGVTLFELLTGKVPFPDGDVAYHHRHSAIPDPRERAPDIPDTLAEIVMQLMAKQAEERCSSAAEVRERLLSVTD
ncbi:MAG: protein kinase [Deltaproteobacteria bacterium]|nr:protein kinase [Deltaproteobacteria bacterium]MBW2421324.1 protein kinase [Deltaproteobacteria bacterium]